MELKKSKLDEKMPNKNEQMKMRYFGMEYMVEKMETFGKRFFERGTWMRCLSGKITKKNQNNREQ